MAIKGIEIKEGFTLRACDKCKKVYYADNRNLKRGWGLCCSKRCAAKKREQSKPGYNSVTVAINNQRRSNWNMHKSDFSDIDEMYGHFSNEE